ncbi:Hypothetical Protein FCC1311_048212 [Hondaea fermentalgiana]|uniref:Uncharacterized protein n=1 Tax=Hondaea fermentalgiana TaxID=2315210 RepID=A0A2R5GCA0_9STRA|nr:Hypothetical Protein FCC1311_048212 [Hondaea fermentalgiana]|eukprot:GBG28600.1 Hypothetical Protein FCC1311_048212 [Hondaea fermentalgiana]
MADEDSGSTVVMVVVQVIGLVATVGTILYYQHLEREVKYDNRVMRAGSVTCWMLLSIFLGIIGYAIGLCMYHSQVMRNLEHERHPQSAV